MKQVENDNEFTPELRFLELLRPFSSPQAGKAAPAGSSHGDRRGYSSIDSFRSSEDRDRCCSSDPPGALGEMGDRSG